MGVCGVESPWRRSHEHGVSAEIFEDDDSGIRFGIGEISCEHLRLWGEVKEWTVEEHEFKVPAHRV